MLETIIASNAKSTCGVGVGVGVSGACMGQNVLMPFMLGTVIPIIIHNYPEADGQFVLNKYINKAWHCNSLDHPEVHGQFWDFWLLCLMSSTCHEQTNSHILYYCR